MLLFFFVLPCENFKWDTLLCNNQKLSHFSRLCWCRRMAKLTCNKTYSRIAECECVFGCILVLVSQQTVGQGHNRERF